PDKFGLASLTGALMNEGTENFTAEEFERELQKLGSSIGVSAGTENVFVTMQSLERNLDATLDLLQERLFRSRFTQEDLDRLRQQQIEGLQADMQQPAPSPPTTGRACCTAPNIPLPRRAPAASKRCRASPWTTSRHSAAAA